MTPPAPPARRRFPDGPVRAVLLAALLAALLLAVVAPLAELALRAVHEDGRFVGLAHFRTYFSRPALYQSFFNSVTVALWTTAITVTAAFLYAYGLTRTCMRGKFLFRALAMLPIFAPTMLYGLSLVYGFGNRGLFTTGFFGALPFTFRIPLYGPVGIVIAETMFTFPAAFLILSVALSAADSRLYEAARSLGARPARVFLSVTLPGARYGLLSAGFVVFTMAFTDFGAPKIVGGHYNVLAVDIYKQVVGQHNFSMGAVISLVLLGPALAAFAADRFLNRRQAAALSARSVPWSPAPAPARDAVFTLLCSLIAAFMLLMIGLGAFGSFVKIWPYNFSLSLAHYRFEGTAGRGLEPLWNSIRLSLWTAGAGTAFAFLAAWLAEKGRAAGFARRALYGVAMLPLALPGLVIGLAYIFFFNRPDFPIPFTARSLPNPFGFLYGSMALLVISTIVHFFTVAFLTATAALRQLDREFEAVSESLAAPFWTLLRTVTVPVSLPALLEIAMFFFVNAMTTVSALILLYSPAVRTATVAVVNMEDAGDTAPAAALCMLIVAVNLAARGLFEIAARAARRRTQAWRNR